MQKHIDYLIDDKGNAVAGAEVEVRTYPADALATIYSDNGVTTTTNPLTTDSLGKFEFYAADGRYTLVISGTGIVTRTLTDSVMLQDLSEAPNVFSGNGDDYPQFKYTATVGSDLYSGSYIGVEFSTEYTATNYSGVEFDFRGGIGSPYYAYIIVENVDASGGRYDFFTKKSNGTLDGRQFRITHTDSSNRWVTVTGSNGGNPTISTNAGNLSIGTILVCGSGVVSVSDGGAFGLYIANRSTDDYGAIKFVDNAQVTTQGIIRSGTTGNFDFLTGTANSQQVQIIHTASATRYLTLTGSNGGNPSIGTSGGGINFSVAAEGSSYIRACYATATPAGGTANTGLLMGAAGVGVFWGSGAPTLSAPQGSIYLRTDAPGANQRIYSNNNGSTGWSAITSA